ncbi:anthranilate synthase component II [Desulfovibrio psychrotolerans]|uniref:Aminodeoxychorismate/anthranilate synthase component II n=1 Tax=Desulfovibrio psychrotolerans TaxID=415242 RepID=A0A7J0BVR0_9BACT|nr:aminodeoxychorismate/anthranilate synthase component II [Desulfovibrio psychrotolerans]GFM37763.1 aminodeoxychorismate/anthranilate synthase component II [Desulfovibrio psychrotolerans]
MFLLIDNYDSFTFNLVQAFQKTGRFPEVRKNDDVSILELAQSGKLDMVCISPGPSNPQNAGLCLEFLSRLPKTVPVLGVCLGHQILGHFAGASVVVGPRIMHGKSSMLEHDGTGLFTGVSSPMRIGRYHSLIVHVHEAPDLLEATCAVHTEAGETEVMALRYRDRPWVGVQFHPESVLTPEGEILLGNFPDRIL